MRTIKGLLLLWAGLVLIVNLAYAQSLPSIHNAFRGINVSLESATDVQTMLEAVVSVPPVAFASLDEPASSVTSGGF